MHRVVLDTNILISALGWDGNERKILKKCIQGDIQLIESLELLNELIKVLQRQKFNFISARKKAEFLKYLVEISELVYPKERLNLIIEDPTDNKVLECALKGNANYIISGDLHLLNLEEFRKIKIVNPTKFLKLTSPL